MFLKILLVIAVCFQAFCYVVDSKTVVDNVPGDLQIGRIFKVEVYDPVVYPEVTIRLYPLKDTYKNQLTETYLTMEVSRRTGVITIYSEKTIGQRNYLHNYYWGEPESSHNITIDILMEKDYFDIIADGKQFFQYHLLPVMRSSRFSIRSEQVLKTCVGTWHRQFVPCPCGFQQTNIPD